MEHSARANPTQREPLNWPLCGPKGKGSSNRIKKSSPLIIIARDEDGDEAKHHDEDELEDED